MSRVAAAFVFALSFALTGGAGASGRADGEPKVEAAPPATLLPFRSGSGAFRAAFPGEPRFDEATQLTLLGRLRTQGWEVEDAEIRVRVERHEVPALALTLFGAEGLLARAESGLLEDIAARNVEAGPLAFAGRTGRRLRYEPGDRPGLREEARLFIAGRHLYVVFARGASRAARELAARFLESVEIEGP
jgi:hypothetical protein